MDDVTGIGYVMNDAASELDTDAGDSVRRTGRKRLLRRRMLTRFVDGGLGSVAKLLGRARRARPSRHGVERIVDVPYGASNEPHHTLDVYRPDPAERPTNEPLPVVLYIHGGGFRVLSKDTHWVMGLAFARKGYIVFNINYRLAPAHRFPKAVEDVCEAYLWVLKNAASFGGDPNRILVAGESAGANLAATLALCCSYERPEPFAKRVFDAGVVPRAVMPAAGIFQVSDPGRFARRKGKLPFYVNEILSDVSDCYLPLEDYQGNLDLADPLLFLEQQLTPARPLPPFFLPVGTADVLLDDTRRMKAALDALNSPAEAHYFPGEVHAFHAMVWRKQAQMCWRLMLDFAGSKVAE